MKVTKKQIETVRDCLFFSGILPDDCAPYLLSIGSRIKTIPVFDVEILPNDEEIYDLTYFNAKAGGGHFLFWMNYRHKEKKTYKSTDEAVRDHVMKYLAQAIIREDLERSDKALERGEELDILTTREQMPLAMKEWRVPEGISLYSN